MSIITTLTLEGITGRAIPGLRYIVLERLPLVYFPVYPNDEIGPIPRLSKTWIADHLPPSPARDHMLSLELDVVNESDGDADGMSAVSIVASHYVRAVKRVSFGGWMDVGEAVHLAMCRVLRDDPNGTALVVTQADALTAAVEYQRAFLSWANARVICPFREPSSYRIERRVGDGAGRQRRHGYDSCGGAVRSPLTREHERINTILFYGVVLLFGYLFVRILAPFFAPLGWASVLAIVVYPWHEKLAPRYGPSRAAFVSTFVVTVLLVGPGLVVLTGFVQESRAALSAVDEDALRGTVRLPRGGVEPGSRVDPGRPECRPQEADR